MKKDTLLLIGFGLMALYLMQQNQQPRYPMYPQIPPAPPRSNGQAFAAWVKSIMDIYGNVRSLWEPGGPFYKEQITQQEAEEYFFT